MCQNNNNNTENRIHTNAEKSSTIIILLLITFLSTRWFTRKRIMVLWQLVLATLMTLHTEVVYTDDSTSYTHV